MKDANGHLSVIQVILTFKKMDKMNVWTSKFDKTLHLPQVMEI